MPRATLPTLVVAIILDRSKEKVLGIYAAGIVTAMANLETLRDFADKDDVTCSVGSYLFAVEAKPSVAATRVTGVSWLTVATAGPFPATVRMLFNLLQEAFFWGFAHNSVFKSCSERAMYRKLCRITTHYLPLIHSASGATSGICSLPALASAC